MAECVRTLDEAGVAVTVNDMTPVAGADVSAGYAAAGIPAAISPGQTTTPTELLSVRRRWNGTSIMPQALLDQGVTKIAVVRADVLATALAGFFSAVLVTTGRGRRRSFPGGRHHRLQPVHHRRSGCRRRGNRDAGRRPGGHPVPRPASSSMPICCTPAASARSRPTRRPGDYGERRTSTPRSRRPAPTCRSSISWSPT